jgi:hypothetical protein
MGIILIANRRALAMPPRSWAAARRRRARDEGKGCIWDITDGERVAQRVEKDEINSS